MPFLTNVLVPWERVFAARDVETYNLIAPRMPGYFALQAVIRGAVKLRFMTGLACLVAHSIGRSEITRYQELIGELVSYVELADGLVTATAHEVWTNAQAGEGETDSTSEAVAAAKSFVPGLATPFWGAGQGHVGHHHAAHLFSLRSCTRAVEVIRLAGSSGLVMTPTEQDFRQPCPARTPATLSAWPRHPGQGTGAHHEAGLGCHQHPVWRPAIIVRVVFCRGSD